MISFSLSDQATYFICSIVMGLALGAVYDIVRAVRMLTRSKGVRLIISDIVFFALCGVATSLFALPFNKGGVRGFVILGEGLGFLVWRLLPGSIMGKIYSRLALFLHKISQIIYNFFEKLFNFLLKTSRGLLYNIYVVIDKLRAKSGVNKKPKKGKDRFNVQKKNKNSKRGYKGRKAEGR